MLLSRLAHRISPTPRIGIRLSSTIVGKSGREYIQREVLSEPKDTRSNIFKAESHDQSFVSKRVPESYYDVSLRLAADFPHSRRLRLHVDSNDEEKLLIYPYYQNTLLRLLQEDPVLSDAARKKVLRHTAEAIQELHSKDWIHNDVKPDNILVNWTCDDEVSNGSGAYDPSCNRNPHVAQSRSTDWERLVQGVRRLLIRTGLHIYPRG
ncbi:hypothetical protein ACET3X_006411 [Alternaria dauci]|uniref:Protein kinase domain-containing protein n=1 Tax=Alternaria dauci TaxID=48095 RepID=A0ABR3UDM0_9PLEO